MSRAPLNVLVFPFRRTVAGIIEYAIFRRSDGDYWQGVAGGAEVGETAQAAARRELQEETGVGAPHRWIALDSVASVPASAFSGHDWGADVYVVTERAFGVELGPDQEIVLSHEHGALEWTSFAAATKRLRWDSNRTALWELDQRLSGETRKV